MASGNRRHENRQPRRDAVTMPPLWQLLVTQLDPHQFDFTPADIAAIVGTTDQAVRKHCRGLWPEHEGLYRLEFDDAALLICRICRDGQKLPDRQHLYQELLQSHRISPNFPQDAPHVLRAISAVQQARTTRSAQG